jgi:CubicO group peptidase (beta-lactamase class C family)
MRCTLMKLPQKFKCLGLINTRHLLPLLLILVFSSGHVQCENNAGSNSTSRVDEIFSKHNVPGRPGAAVVVVENGTVIFKSGYGFADIDNEVPVATDTAFHLASVGKQISAVAVMLLVKEGKISLEDLVAKHLPQFRGWGARVKVKHLLYHTSGVPDYYEDIEDTYKRPTNAQALKYLKSLGYLEFRPGAKFSYSNSGYDTVGALIQAVSKQKFSDFVDEKIFHPLEMSNTYAFNNARREASKRAIGYYSEDGVYYKDDTSPLNGLHGSGSIYSSVEDMAKYDAALFSGNLLPESLRAQLFVSGKTNKGTSIRYGLGWELGNESAPYYGHSGAWMGFSTYYLHYPARKLSVIVVSNDTDADAEGLAFSTAVIFK